EPFGDSSQIPTLLVSRMAREHVTVSLSGDGGDELFGGYNRHVVGPALWERLERLPAPLRRALGRAVGMVARMDRLPGTRRVPQLAEKLDKLSRAMCASTGADFYQNLLSHWKHPEAVVLGADESTGQGSHLNAMPALPGLCEQMLYWDMMGYLPDDI